MIPRSEKFDRLLAYDHTEVFRAELWNNGNLIREPSVLGGNLTVDGGAEVLRRCSLSLTGADLLNIPGLTHNEADKMWPVGSELRLFAGIVHPDTLFEEFLPQGVFRLSKPKVSESNSGEITVSCEGYDRSRQVARNRWWKPYTIPDGTNLATAISTILADRLPGVDLEFNFAPTSYTIPETTFEWGGNSNPWKDCLDLATAGGMEVFFDVSGRPTLRDIADPATVTPVATYSEDVDCTLLDVDRELDEESGYSGVCVVGEHPDGSPLTAYAWDTDPLSPTWIESYGYVPYFVDTQFIKNVGGQPNQSQAQAIADKTLLQVRGIIERVSFNAISNFAHEQNDPIVVKRSGINVNNQYILDGFSRVLEEGGAMNAVTRKRRVS